MTFDIVVAHDLNRGIGMNNALPWQCAPDMAHFKTLTTSHESNGQNTVIMGRKTWASIPEKFRPLAGRKNIVVSSTLDQLEGAQVAPSLDAALDMSTSNGNVFVIGGAQLYLEALAHQGCDTLHVTKIFKRCECDTFFLITPPHLIAHMHQIFG